MGSNSNNLLNILQCCDLIRELNEEFQKPFGWLRIKEKREFKKLKNKVMEMIDSLYKDEWTVKYLMDFEHVFLMYYDTLENYNDEIYIEDHSLSSSISRFRPIYFAGKQDDKVISIEILEITNSETIVFTIVDIKTMQKLQILSAEGKTNSSQTIVEFQCKQKIIKMLKWYLDNISVDKKVATENFMKKVEKDIRY